MDRGELTRKFKESDVTAADAVARGTRDPFRILDRLEGLHAAFVECRTGFDRVLLLTTSDEDSSGPHSSGRVVLEKDRNHAALGVGDMVARVAKGSGESYYTVVHFIPRLGEPIGLMREDFAAGLMAGSVVEFEGMDVDDVSHRLRGTSQDLAHVGRALWPDILQARETLTVLEQAMRNTELNPDIAARIADQEAADQLVGQWRQI